MNTSTISATLVGLFVLLLSSAATFLEPRKGAGGYDLSKPDTTFILPDTLHKISGLTDIDAHAIACVQDENGVLFFYDLENSRIAVQYTFHIDGDYEGITRVGDSMYFLRSDGTLFQKENYKDQESALHTYTTGIPAKDNEGLCYDYARDRLLIACKSKLGKGPEFKDNRGIYAFDLHSKQLSNEPVFEFDLQAIQRSIDQHGIQLPMRTKKNGEVIEDPVPKFKLSALAVHPNSGLLYLLSAHDHLFFIFNMKGEPVHVEALDPRVFNKAEGITFMANGDMLISNEGVDGNPTLLRFVQKY